MSEYEKKNNRGAAFVNKSKDKPSQPDFVGTIVIDGKEKRVAVWKNKSIDGSEYMTFILSEQLTDEEKSNYRNLDSPAQAPFKKSDIINGNRNANANANRNGNNIKNTQIKNENNEINDLHEILKLDDDDPPF